MKKGLFWGTLVLVGLHYAQGALAARSVITRWDFNRTTETNTPPPAIGGGEAHRVGPVTASFATGAGSSDTETEADSAWNIAGFPSQGTGSESAGVEFRVSTVGYSGVVVRLDVRPSNTASRVLLARYTIDGSAYLEGPRFVLTTGGVFTNGLVIDLSTHTGVADNPSFGLRIVSAFDEGGRYAAVNGNYSAAGTWRLDMVTLFGERIGGDGGGGGGNVEPEPGTGEPPAIQFVCRLSQLQRSGDAPTNRFPDQSVGPGERLEIDVEIVDPDDHPYRVSVVEPVGIPSGSGWLDVPSEGSMTGSHTLRFAMTGDSSIEGRRFEPSIQVVNDAGTRQQSWRVYVPTAAERNLVLMEFLANPTGVSTNATFNPLRRDPPSTRPTQHDEYLELVNYGESTLDLAGWRLRDSTGWRHVFGGPTLIGSSNVLVLHGGISGTPAPNIDEPTMPVGEGVVGLSLNNDGDAIALYNGATNLVFRVVYTADMVASAASLTRFPDRDGAFVAQTSVSSQAVTPGKWYDGRSYESGAGIVDGGGNTGVRLEARGDGAGAIVVEWESEAGVAYRVWRAESVDGDFLPLTEALSFEQGRGRFVEPADAASGIRFYRVSRP